MGLLGWLRTVGGASIFLGGSGMLTEPEYFWWSASAVYIGVALLGVDLLVLEPGVAAQGVLVRSLLVAAFAFILGLFTFGVVLADSPLDVVWLANNAKYPAGTVKDGIEWRPEFSELMLSISNGSEHAYSDLNVIVRPDQPVAAIAHVTGPEVSFEPATIITPSIMLLDGKNEPLANPMVLAATEGGYRIRCERLPPKTTIRVLMALATIKQQVSTPQEILKGFKKDDVLGIEFFQKDRKDHKLHSWFALKGGAVFGARPTMKSMTWSADFVSVYRWRHVAKP